MTLPSLLPRRRAPGTTVHGFNRAGEQKWGLSRRADHTSSPSVTVAPLALESWWALDDNAQTERGQGRAARELEAPFMAGRRLINYAW